jgi:hypothetical protein
MKKLPILLALLCSAAVVRAEDKSSAPGVGGAPAAAKMKTHDVPAEVVSADPENNTLTVRTEDGATKVVPTEGEASAALRDVQPGSKVTLTCRDDDAGAHQKVIAIKKVNPTT